jgi:hypothetical protein
LGFAGVPGGGTGAVFESGGVGFVSGFACLGTGRVGGGAGVGGGGGIFGFPGVFESGGASGCGGPCAPMLTALPAINTTN